MEGLGLSRLLIWGWLLSFCRCSRERFLNRLEQLNILAFAASEVDARLWVALFEPKPHVRPVLIKPDALKSDTFRTVFEVRQAMLR